MAFPTRTKWVSRKEKGECVYHLHQAGWGGITRLGYGASSCLQSEAIVDESSDTSWDQASEEIDRPISDVTRPARSTRLRAITPTMRRYSSPSNSVHQSAGQHGAYRLHPAGVAVYTCMRSSCTGEPRRERQGMAYVRGGLEGSQLEVGAGRRGARGRSCEGFPIICIHMDPSVPYTIAKFK